MASPHLRHRAWTLYLWMAVLAIVLGVLMFLLAGGWRAKTVAPNAAPNSSIGLLRPAAVTPASLLG